MSRFSYLAGTLTGFLFALILLGWWGFSVGIGVSGDVYVWPFELFTTDVWVTGDVFLTLTASVAGLAVFAASREASS
ncbi:MAG: hypothetical protein JRN17_03450 [Nitrososphaerota archaeon]|jgi:hypothetical protein|nr:hypothetical protein [Nitrososphaerota archaeon]MDG6964970.1 hypothetical protein [Nitrososphaerota archaeon]MDG6968470.1 hypothetical protein [Nitrososphaerota archaeon]MDG6971126.1 hypothetical protein [Nitrososphaerota archaeon]MDG6975977.1 hypothetical protein [Nitrososphaerota archaeon]